MELTRLGRIFSATNGSETGQHSVQFAHRLAKRVGAKFRILTVRTPGIPGYPEEQEPVYGEELLPYVTASRGIPGIEIVRTAEAWMADLVVIGRRDRSAGEDDELGRTVEAVVRRYNGPSLLVPRGVDRLERMLIALDGTQRGNGILPSAEMLAKLAGLEAHAVCVREGNPVQEILAAVKDQGVDVLVLGVRRGGPPGEAGSGHIGRDLLKRAPVAILTVPI